MIVEPFPNMTEVTLSRDQDDDEIVFAEAIFTFLDERDKSKGGTGLQYIHHQKQR